MELSGTLLVAIMFSTVVGLSIGGFLFIVAGPMLLLICIAVVCAFAPGRKVQGWMCATAWVVTVGSAFPI